MKLDDFVTEYIQYVSQLTCLVDMRSLYYCVTARADCYYHNSTPDGNNNPLFSDGSVNYEWVRVPAPDFDKDARVYVYAGENQKKWRILNATSNNYPGKVIIIEFDLQQGLPY